MAKFGEEYAFDSIEVEKFYRIPLSCSSNYNFLNVGKNSVIKIQDRKPLHTWTLVHPHYFTSPVVYFDEVLYCAMDNNVLLKWSINEETLKSAKKLKFQDSIFAIIPVGKVPLILFHSGQYTLLDSDDPSDLKFFKFEFCEDNEDFIWADASTIISNIKVFCLTYNRKTKQHIIYNSIINKDEKTELKLHSYNLFNSTSLLNSWCLSESNSIFLYIWSDGLVQELKGTYSHASTLLYLKDTESTTVTSIDSIDSTHIVIAKGILKQKECVLEIWDTKFNVLKARKFLKISCLKSLQIAAENHKVFLCVNKELILIPFSVEQSALSVVVDKSITECSKTLDILWDNKKQLKEAPGNEAEPMDVAEYIEEPSDPIELIAQKLLSHKSQYLKRILESELAKLLQLALKYHKENKSKKYTKKEAYIILNIVFSASFNDIYLVKYLKRMNLDETLTALELLLSYLNHTLELPSTIADKPSDLQIVNWMCLIIQSHMEALLFSKDKKSRTLLKKLEKAISVKMEEYEDFECIQNYFLILQKKILPQKCSAGKYCIETLDI